MKITCHRGALSTAFQTVAGVIPSRTPKSILQNVKLHTTTGEAILMGTDQEIGVRIKLAESEVEVPGDILLPTARVQAILRELQGDTVRIEASSDATWIRSDRAEYKLSTEDPAEFPNVAPFDEANYHTLQAGQFKQMIRRTIFATDTESTRYALGGVLVDVKGEEIVLAATDTRRLAVVRGKCGSQGTVPADVGTPVVPAKAMSLIERSLVDEESVVSLSVRPNDVLLQSGATTIYSRLVEGRFPKYQDVIPTDTQLKLHLVTGPFYAAVRQAQIVTNEESRGVDFNFAPGLLTLRSQAAEVGQSKVELPISYDGAEVTITFDPRYVSEFLKVLGPEQQIHLELIDSESAAVFRTDDGYAYIIMPLSRDR